MSGTEALNINAAMEKQIKESLHVGMSKARLILTKWGQQPNKCFTAESFLREVKRMEGASQWVERGLICFGPPQTPKRKTRGLARRGKKTPSPTTHTPQQKPQTPSRQLSPTSSEGDPQEERDTALLGEGGRDPSIIRGDRVDYDGLVGVPPTPMYTSYGQPLTPYAFGHGYVGPITLRGFGLGASPINLSSRPRFPGFPGQSPYGLQPYPMGFNPRVPGGSTNGISKGPISRISSTLLTSFLSEGRTCPYP